MASHLPPEILTRKKIVIIAGMIIVAIAYFFDVYSSRVATSGFSSTTPQIIGTYYHVTKVVDGDTLHIDMDGHNERVRLIGINTPETVDPRRQVECYGKEASQRMKEIANGKLVRLEYDESQSTRDAYGRLLAYIYLEDGQMLNRKMIAEGYAYEYTYLTPYRYQKEFRQLQTLAQGAKRGLWADDTCNGSKKSAN